MRMIYGNRESWRRSGALSKHFQRRDWFPAITLNLTMPAQNRFWHDLCQGLITWCQDNWEVVLSLKKSREIFCRVSIFRRSARWCEERSLIGLDSSMKIWSSDKRWNSLPEC